MNRPVACSSVISRIAVSGPAGRRMKRSILPGMRMSAFIGLPSEIPASCSATVNPRLGVAGIDRLLQHPAVEMQPGKLAIDEAFGTGARCWAGRSIRNFLFYYNGLRGFHEVSVHPMAAICAIIAHAAKHVLSR